MGALNPWVAAGRDINDPLLLQQRGSLFASQGAPWDAVAGLRQLLRVCPLGLCLRQRFTLRSFRDGPHRKEHERGTDDGADETARVYGEAATEDQASQQTAHKRARDSDCEQLGQLIFSPRPTRRFETQPAARPRTRMAKMSTR
jgi:hypothetical protein